MQEQAVAVAKIALNELVIEKDVASYIKEEFDKKHNPSWHGIVGCNFGSSVTHQTKHFVHFYTGQIAVLSFKSA